MLSHAEFVETGGNLQQAMTQRWSYSNLSSHHCGRDGCGDGVTSVLQRLVLGLPLILVIEASSAIDLSQLTDASPEDKAKARAANNTAAAQLPDSNSGFKTSEFAAEPSSDHDEWDFPSVLSVPMSSACFVLVGEVHHSLAKSHYHCTATPPGSSACFPHDGMVASGMISPQDKSLSGPGHSKTTHAVYMLCQGAYPTTNIGIRGVREALLKDRRGFLANKHGIEVHDFDITPITRITIFDYGVTQPNLVRHPSLSNRSTPSPQNVHNFVNRPGSVPFPKQNSTGTAEGPAPRRLDEHPTSESHLQESLLDGRASTAEDNQRESQSSSPIPDPSQFRIPGYIRQPTPSPIMFACVCGVEGTYDTLRASMALSSRGRFPLCSRCLRRSHAKCSKSKNYPKNGDFSRSSGWICQLCQDQKDELYLEEVRQKYFVHDEGLESVTGTAAATTLEATTSNRGTSQGKADESEDDDEKIDREIMEFYHDQKMKYWDLYDVEAKRLAAASNHPVCESNTLNAIVLHASKF